MNDPYRPQHHFTPARGRLGDPLGLFFDGTYHIFFQYHPGEQPDWNPQAWGHTVSRDLVHWKELPVAIAPTEGAYDKDGCFSGSIVEHEGLFHAFYTAIDRTDPKRPRESRRCTQAHATSTDLTHWEKDERNPIME